MFKDLFDFAKEIITENPAKFIAAIPAYIIGRKLRNAPLRTKVPFVITAGIVGGAAGYIDAELEARRSKFVPYNAL